MITGFPIDVYDCDLSFAIDSNQKELDAFFDEIGLPEDGRQSFKDQFDKDPSMKIEALTCNFGTPNYIIVFNSEPSPKAVAHEIFHAAYQILHPRASRTRRRSPTSSDTLPRCSMTPTTSTKRKSGAGDERERESLERMEKIQVRSHAETRQTPRVRPLFFKGVERRSAFLSPRASNFKSGQSKQIEYDHRETTT